MKNLSQIEWQQAIENDVDAVVIDVRTKEEYQNGIIENAMNLDVFEMDKFLSEINHLDKSKNYFVYCMAGGRSASACKVMMDAGFENVFNLLGGINAWNGKIVTHAE